jgi:hypothetical protein
MLRARLVALLTSLLLLWPVGVQAHARYFCRMMDRVMDSCCCEGESALEALLIKAEVKAEGEVQARTPDCCVRLTQGALPAADTRRDAATPSSMPALPAANALQLPAVFQREVLELAGVEDEAVVARGPPLFLKHCVFLI